MHLFTGPYLRSTKSLLVQVLVNTGDILSWGTASQLRRRHFGEGWVCQVDSTNSLQCLHASLHTLLRCPTARQSLVVEVFVHTGGVCGEGTGPQLFNQDAPLSVVHNIKCKISLAHMVFAQVMKSNGAQPVGLTETLEQAKCVHKSQPFLCST